MDPLSFALTIAGVAGLCAKVSKTIYTLANTADDGIHSLQTLKKEIDFLYSVVTLLLARMKGRRTRAPRWGFARESLVECRQILQALDAMFRNQSSSIVMKFLESEIQSRKIKALTEQITTHRQKLALSLTWYSFLVGNTHHYL